MWTTPRRDTFTYQRLSPSGALIGSIDGVVRGRITENLNTALKASGSLEVVGDIDFGNDRIRVVWHADDGESVLDVVLGTFLATTPSRTRDGATTSGRVEMYSTLLVLNEDRIETTLTVPAGSAAVETARALAAGSGAVVVAAESSATTNVDMTFKAGSTLLEIVNALLDFAGFSSAGVDAMGNVVMAPYRDPSGRQPVWTLRDDGSSILLPVVDDELDLYDVPNVVTLTVSNAETTLTATAVNDDPASPYSTVSRGRRIVRFETVTDITDQAALQAKADLLRTTSSTRAQALTVRHTYAPIAIGDPVRLDYRAAALDHIAVVQSIDRELSPGVPMTTKLRRWVSV